MALFFSNQITGRELLVSFSQAVQAVPAEKEKKVQEYAEEKRAAVDDDGIGVVLEDNQGDENLDLDLLEGDNEGDMLEDDQEGDVGNADEVGARKKRSYGYRGGYGYGRGGYGYGRRGYGYRRGGYGYGRGGYGRGGYGYRRGGYGGYGRRYGGYGKKY